MAQTLYCRIAYIRFKHLQAQVDICVQCCTVRVHCTDSSDPLTMLFEQQALRDVRAAGLLKNSLLVS
eukprot:20273-Heterococcus_DN1.PRE.1